MVIAKCLRSPQQGSVEIAASAGTTVPQLFPLVGTKFKLNKLRALFGRSHKLPFLHGVLACLNEQRMSPDGPRAFYMTVRRDDDFNFDFAGNVHSSGEIGILRCRLILVLPLGFIRSSCLTKSTNTLKNNQLIFTHIP